MSLCSLCSLSTPTTTNEGNIDKHLNTKKWSLEPIVIIDTKIVEVAKASKHVRCGKVVFGTLHNAHVYTFIG